jgi:mannose-6-phosphate isomerase-like protein (cupin superfamily)
MSLDRIIRLVGDEPLGPGPSRAERDPPAARHLITVERDGRSTLLETAGHPAPFRWGDVLWPARAGAPERTALAPGEIGWRLYTLTDDASLDRYLADRYGSDGGGGPGMHRTPTIDFVLILDGRLELVLDDSTVELGPGDTVIQQATAHAWRVLEPPVRMSVVMIGS